MHQTGSSPPLVVMAHLGREQEALAMSMFTRTFLAAAAERAVKTFAQTLAALVAANGSGVLDVDWAGGLSVAVSAAVVSLLTSVASGGVGQPGPSLVGEGLARPAPATAPGPASMPLANGTA
jgi:hypothetical protein